MKYENIIHAYIKKSLNLENALSHSCALQMEEGRISDLEVCVTIDRVSIGESDLLTTCVHHSKLHFIDHWHTHRLASLVYYSLH
jgi:hypothetical protein